MQAMKILCMKQYQLPGSHEEFGQIVLKLEKAGGDITFTEPSRSALAEARQIMTNARQVSF